MHIRKNSLIALISVLATASGATAAPVAPFKLSYSIKLSGFNVGHALSELRSEGDGRYVYRRVAKANGFAKLFVADRIEERSQWNLVNDSPRAMRFDFVERDGDEEKREQIQFDWEHRKAAATWKNRTTQIDIPPNTSDRLTMEMRMVMDVRENKQKFVYQIVDKGRVKTRTFVSQGNDQLETPAGTFNTLQFKMQRDDKKKRSTVFWLAKELNYLPVRIEHHEQGDGYSVAFELSKVLTPGYQSHSAASQPISESDDW